MSDFALYNYFRSSTSYRARIALNFKGIAYEYSPVHLLQDGGQQHRAEYRSLNPSGEVPTLLHQGRAIGQSVAIIEYIEEIHPTPALYPKDPYIKAKVRQFCETINSGIHSYQNLKTLKYLGSALSATEQQRTDWTSHWICQGMESLEKQLDQTSGKFCFKDEITAADLFLIPQVFAAKRFNVDLSSYPKCLSISDHCDQLDAFKKAHPFRQPDTPVEMRII